MPDNDIDGGDEIDDRGGAVAVVGIGCRFPGGITDPSEFWDLLVAGVDATTDVPPDRWDTAAFFDPDPAVPGRASVHRGGFLTGPVDVFDAGFFGLPPREAAALDPQQRLLLEVAWEAFEDAGIPPGRTAGGSVGAYVGGFTFDAATHQLAADNRDLVGTATPTGVSMTMLAARLAYTFDWRGPAVTLDTACSSSLVALHHACAGLARGDCDVAVAAGVNVMVSPTTTVLMSKGGFLSPDGRCKSFDHRADGYGRGEGAGLLVLKPWAAARRDGDRVRALVRGTAVNQDGRTPGITVPSGGSQRAVIRAACRDAGVEPGSVGYVEAHGTGTAVGDPIEVAAIGDVLRDGTADSTADSTADGTGDGTGTTRWIGSVKANIGHTEAAAGVAGVIKACLCLERGAIPPNLHLERPNPAIPFDRLALRVPTATVPFPTVGEHPRRAGVNSFGFGGTNAHAILEQAPASSDVDESVVDGPLLLPVSARGTAALRARADGVAALLERPSGPSLSAVCRTAAREREHHPSRRAVVADDAAQAAAALREPAPVTARPARDGVAFVYTGMGPQWWGMGAELLATEPVFADVVSACDDVLAGHGIRIVDELRRDEASSRLTSTLYAQVANAVVQIGLTALWRHHGIEPAAVVGHSVGEVAALYAAGVYTLDDALTVGVHRARLQSRLAGRGAMVAVGLPAAQVVDRLDDGVGVAAVNSASATVLSGDADAVARTAERLRALEVPVTPLRVEVAYHSHHMDSVREPLLEALAGLRPRRAGVPLYSTVTGDRVDGPELDAGYWWRNVREPVRFADAFRRLVDPAGPVAPGRVVEVGPHPVLAGAIDEVLAATAGDVVRVASLRRDRPQRRQMLESLGALYTSGADPAWERVHPGPRAHVDLPRYPWQRERYWVESAASRRTRLPASGPRMAGTPVLAPTEVRDVALSGVRFPWLGDHRISSSIVFPGSGYLEAALAGFADETPCVLEDVVFDRPLALPPHSVPTLRVEHDPVTRRLTVDGRGQDDESWTRHARMRHPELHRPVRPAPWDTTPEELTAGWPAVERDEVERDLAGGELHYGPSFHGLRRFWWHAPDAGPGEVVAEIDTGVVDGDGYRLHPALLDAALQAVIAGGLRVGAGQRAGTWVPARIDELRFHRSPGHRLWLYGRERPEGRSPGRLECDLTLVTDDGEIVAEVRGLRAQRLGTDDADETGAAARLRPDGVHLVGVWRPVPLPDAPPVTGTWVLAGADEEHALAAALRTGGATVVCVPPGPDVPERAARAASDPACRGVVHLHHRQRDGDASTPACAPVTEPLRLAQILPQGVGTLVLVTAGTQAVHDGDPAADPGAAAIWGLSRVIAAERPDLRCRPIDLADTDDPSDPCPKTAAALAAELGHDGTDEVALRDATRYVRTLERAGRRAGHSHVPVTAGATPVRLDPGDEGLDGLGFAVTERRAPGPGEAEIEVSHAGVNFKDVLKATGLLTEDARAGSHSGALLGLECAGRIVRVGPDVPDLRPGDDVVVHSRDLFASHVTVEAVRVVRRPASLSAAHGASLLPVVTAQQALVRLAGVRAGERVLVHSGAGGVGLAAVRIARALGAEVYATAGSDARRAVLAAEGVAAVADSRSTSFADEILAATHGEGVDVVVGSLTGEMRHRSIALLRPFGRYVELGKTDIAADRPLGLAPFGRALSFHAFDYDRMMRDAPQRVRECLTEAVALLDRGTIAPLPVTELPAERVDDAFRAMTRGEHHGKVVVRIAGEPVTVAADGLPGSPVRADGSYLVTGGLGGLGLTTARLLADLGARHLVLLGRYGATSDAARDAVDALTADGVTVVVETADVSDPEQVAAVLERIRRHGPPLRGVLHAAADFDDVVLADTTPERLLAATGPKADGALHLHLATRDDPVEHFVLFSSVAAQIGAAAAGAYATANEFLNGLARHRTGLGLPATAVGWGMVDDVGVAVGRDGAVGRVLRRNGHVGISPARLAAELAVLLRTGPAEVAVADVDWRRWARANPQLAALPRYASLVPADAGDPGDDAADVPRRLRAAPPDERAALLPDLVTPLLQRVTGLSDDQVAADAPVDVDSLTSVELRVLLQNALGVAVPAVALQRNLTVCGLAGLLARELERSPAATLRPDTDLSVETIVSADGTTVFGHLSVPDGPGPHPGVVVCTAGRGGALDDRGEYVQIAAHAPLHAAGVAVLTVDHRGAPGHGPAFAAAADLGGGDVDDVVAAGRHLAAVPGVDPERVGLVGVSRGAYTAILALIRDPAPWRRAALLMGVYDPSALVTDELLPDTGHDRADVEAHFAARERQPLLLLDAMTTPLLLVHGDADDVVGPEQSRRLAEAAVRDGPPTRLRTVPGMGHDTQHDDPAWDGLWPEIVTFLTGEDA